VIDGPRKGWVIWSLRDRGTDEDEENFYVVANLFDEFMHSLSRTEEEWQLTAISVDRNAAGRLTRRRLPRKSRSILLRRSQFRNSHGIIPESKRLRRWHLWSSMKCRTLEGPQRHHRLGGRLIPLELARWVLESMRRHNDDVAIEVFLLCQAAVLSARIRRSECGKGYRLLSSLKPPRKGFA